MPDMKRYHLTLTCTVVAPANSSDQSLLNYAAHEIKELLSAEEEDLVEDEVDDEVDDEA